MQPESLPAQIGIGATPELSLRVSVGALVRVLLEPRDDGPMLALERRATLVRTEMGASVEVKSQPFGGAVRIQDVGPLQDLIGDFHFDSEASALEHDFRIFIRPGDWESVQEFCLQHFDQPHDPVLESDPARELTEEFAETIGVGLEPVQYVCQKLGTLLEEHPSPTENPHAAHYPTVRIYRIFEARIRDPAIAAALLKSSNHCSDQDLRERALEDSENGGAGRASRVLTLPLARLYKAYLSMPPQSRNSPISFEGHRLDETVAAVLDDIPVPKYRRL